MIKKHDSKTIYVYCVCRYTRVESEGVVADIFSEDLNPTPSPPLATVVIWQTYPPASSWIGYDHVTWRYLKENQQTNYITLSNFLGTISEEENLSIPKQNTKIFIFTLFIGIFHIFFLI